MGRGVRLSTELPRLAPRKYMTKHSKRYQQTLEGVDLSKSYSAEEAVDLAKKTSTVKFDASIEAHFKLNIDPKQSDQTVRFAVSLPHGTGKKKKIAAFVTVACEKDAKKAGAELVGGKELIDEIKSTEKLDFDIAVAEPAIMRELAKIAKILGTKGKMPSPKTGTVTPDIGKAIAEIVGGKMDVKNDENGNIHVVIGKASFEAGKLSENFKILFNALKVAKPKSAPQDFIVSATISSSMGPGIKVSL